MPEYNNDVLIYLKSSFEKVNEFLGADEMRCNCGETWCTVTIVNAKAAESFRRLRELIGKPLYISSGYRCQYHNNINVRNSSGTSRHMTGEAMDIIKPEHLALDKFEILAKSAGFSFTKKYTNPERLHCDVR